MRWTSRRSTMITSKCLLMRASCESVAWQRYAAPSKAARSLAPLPPMLSQRKNPPQLAHLIVGDGNAAEADSGILRPRLTVTAARCVVVGGYRIQCFWRS